jgi:hypothetical protein
MEQEIMDYINNTYGDKIQELQLEAKRLLAYADNKYKNKDIVYFKKFYKTKRPSIVSRQFRSVKKYSNLILFPDYKSATDYHILFTQTTFLTLSDMCDDVLPKQLESTFKQFANVKDVSWGDSIDYKISPDDLFQKQINYKLIRK